MFHLCLINATTSFPKLELHLKKEKEKSLTMPVSLCYNYVLNKVMTLGAIHM